MYLRAVHAEHDLQTLRTFIRENPLGVLTTALDVPGHHLIQSSHIPFVIDWDDSRPDQPGTLRGHIARANPQAKAMISALSLQADFTEQKEATRVLEREVLVLFNASTQAYVTPRFYTETKPATGKVVPTWDYAAVQAYGTATIYADAQSDATSSFLNVQISDLTDQCEGLTGADSTWAVDDAPRSYVEILKKGIIGIEIHVTSLAGKWKMSQEMSEGDIKGVIKGFESMESELGEAMAECTRQRAEKMAKEKVKAKASR
jgi:transcriptional regulator